jgi:hypothetical protein
MHGEAGQVEPNTHFRRWCSGRFRHKRRRKPTTAPEWSDGVDWIGRECFSMHTTLGERNQRWPPFHGAVVNSARSSSGNISARKNSSSLGLPFAGGMAIAPPTSIIYLKKSKYKKRTRRDKMETVWPYRGQIGKIWALQGTGHGRTGDRLEKIWALQGTGRRSLLI